jgi:hypothetical protein
MGFLYLCGVHRLRTAPRGDCGVYRLVEAVELLMDGTNFIELQEALLYVFGPIWFWWLVLIASGAFLSAIGALVLELVQHLTR